MMDEVRTEAEDRVVILPPTRRDGEVTRQILERFAIQCAVCADPVSLASQIELGVGAIIITDAVASDPRSVAIIAALNSQPTWSDAPTILLSRPDHKSAAVERLMSALNNVTILDRPTSKRTLVSAVQAAIRGRRRQYQLRGQLMALKEAEDALRTADQRKDEFLAMLAHELRNPLAPIQTASEILARVFPAQLAGRAAVDVVKRQVVHLTRLVDDLLDVSRITQGRIQLQRQPLDIHSIVAQALESVEPFVTQKHHRIIATSEPGKSYVNGDSARLIQCVTNLLTNAVKYTGEGGEIRVEARHDNSDAIISVSDNGIGIAEDLMPRIFDLFVQSARSLDRSEGGLGIGLSVVERLVAMHEGTVSAASPGPGKGSTFEIRLPRIDAMRVPAQQPGRSEFPRKRILVVDDNVDAASSVAELLRLDGHEVHVVNTARAALENFLTYHPDVVLLDIGLPDMNGYQVAQRIRSAGAAVRIIALTGYGQSEDLQRARDSGFDAHLVKPVDFDVLGAVIAGNTSSKTHRINTGTPETSRELSEVSAVSTDRTAAAPRGSGHTMT
jgi:signal transduction histidine kinase/CheY-like chemotaxis protein